jgi:hypothetical protein
MRLGAVWEEQTTSVLLAGNLAPVEARGLIVSTEIHPFALIRLVLHGVKQMMFLSCWGA